MTATLVFVRAQGTNAEGFRRAELERAMVSRDGTTDCFYCGAARHSTGRAIDHVTPRGWRGGSDSVDNLVFACKTCNLLKGDTPGWFYVIWLWARRGVIGSIGRDEGAGRKPPFPDSDGVERPGSQHPETEPPV